MRLSYEKLKERRKKVNELLTKAKSPSEIAKIMNLNYNTVLSDINFIKSRNARLMLTNPRIAEKQMQHIYELKEEIYLIKKEFWNIYEDLKQDKTLKFIKQIKGLNKAKDYMKQKEWAKAIIEIEKIERKLELEKNPRYKTKIETLKAILERIDKEIKVLNLFNPKNFIQFNFVSINNFKEVMKYMRDIIFEFVPSDKRNLAIQRIQNMNINELTGQEIIDAETVKD